MCSLPIYLLSDLCALFGHDKNRHFPYRFAVITQQPGIYFPHNIDKMPSSRYLRWVEGFFRPLTNAQTIKPLQTALLIGAGIVAYSLLRKTTGLSSLVFFPEKVRRVAWESGSPVLEIGLGVQNTTNQQFTIKSIAGNAYSNGNYIGNISMFSPLSIAPNSESVIVAKIRLQLIGVVSDIINAINTGTFGQEIGLELQANVDNVQFPINLKFKAGF